MATKPAWLRASELISIVFALLAGVAIATLALLIAFDIVARSLFRFSVQGTDELGGYTLAFVGSLGLSYSLLRRSHPRIDMFLSYLPRRAVLILHIVAYWSLSGFAMFMAVHAFRTLMETVHFNTVANTPLQTPMWVPQSIWVIGTVAFMLISTGCAVHSVWLLRRPEELIDRYGPPSQSDEINEYRR